MAERLSDVEARIGSVRQLSAVITAMRGIAAVRSHEANMRLDGIRAYAATIGSAIAQALALLPDRNATPSARPDTEHQLVIALCTEQGFVGGFNAHILDAAARLIAQGQTGQTELLLVGSRGLTAASERNLDIAWSAPMVAHVDQVTGLANRLADRVFDRIQTGMVTHVTIVHACPSVQGQAAAIAEQTLLPFDFTRFPPVNLARPPLITLPAPTLLARLADEYVFAELCDALTLSHAAENEARMRAMVAARENVANKLEELSAKSRLLRQEQITEEVIELAAGTQV